MKISEKIREIKEELYYDLYLNNEFIYDLVGNIKYFFYELPFWLKIKRRIDLSDKISITFTDISGKTYTNTEYHNMKKELSEKKEV